MLSRTRVAAAFATVALALVTAPAAIGQGSDRLEMYTLKGQAGKIAKGTQGVELAGQRQTARGLVADAVLTQSQVSKLRASGVKVSLTRNKKGRTVTQQARAMAANGFNVYRSWDEPGGIRDELSQTAAENPQLVKLEVLGQTHQGRDLVALKVTQKANSTPDGSRPAVLYSSNQHAREWISLEVNRRLLHWFIDHKNDAEIKDLLRTTELWFVISANPDGYQFTFDPNERLWRKNLRDNNGDGQITTGDGVDPNRNFASKWGFDNEGSSPDKADETYRGPNPASEPETQFMQGLLDRIKPKFQSNLHSFGQWLLYPQGWQVGTLDADNPIYAALAGLDSDPAIPGFNPGQSADTLYVTNGETTDYADTHAGAIAYTPELGEGRPGAGFVFPDDEGLIQAEFEKTLPFHLSLARSAAHPANPDSSTGIEVEPFYLDQDDIDPQNGQQSLFDFRFNVSYGDPQEVRVLAKRSLGAVSLKYEVNGGAVQTKSTSEWAGGERYGPGHQDYYHVVRGTVTGTSPGDSVKVWFTGGGETSDSFTYNVQSDSGRSVLILSAEDYTGASQLVPPGSGPAYLSWYTDALTANGIAFDVYDVDAHGRTAPDNLGVLSHYDAVVWYTGDDNVTRELGWGAGNASRLAMQELLEVRDYVNEGGHVLYTGQRAGQQYTTALGTQLYDPFENDRCRNADQTVRLPRCLPLSGSGNSQGDPIEYTFGAAITSAGGGIDPEGNPFDIAGLADPFSGLSFGLNGANSAGNQVVDASFIATGDFLKVTDPADEFPQFESSPVAEYLSGIAGPFDPHTGSSFMWSERADEAYKRLTRTISVPAGGATMSFWTSYNLELDFDYLIVEAHTVGQDDWTTLPDQNGHTSNDLSTDESCTGGWSNPADTANVLHPFLQHYQTFNADGTCSNTGTTGEWNAANGSSSGWQQWQLDLSRYAGTDVEISITGLSDWGLQQFPGVFVDDIVVSTGEGSTSFEEDAEPMDGWTVPGAPQDPEGIEEPNRNDWVRRGGLGIKEGAIIKTPDTLYMGFGFEGITTPKARRDVMEQAINYLGG
jgi:Zinc carboxypeptidase/Immune inhibitor A-like, MAM domain